jgi:4-hydroxybenzoate polyprenyltransferase
MQSALESPSSAVEFVPLCVDLDGTLVKSDTLVDSLLALARTRPALLYKLPAHLLRGKAGFKDFVASSVALDVTHLPYNRPLLRYLQQEHAQGRPIYLATGADRRIADRVAAHLGIFHGVLSSDGTTNLTGSKKLSLLRSRFGDAPFDYIGNDTVDLPLLTLARQPMVANPNLRLRMSLRRRKLAPTQTFEEKQHPLKALLKAARVHQWAKNVLMFLPLILSHGLTLPNLLTETMAFFCFSLTASATYIVNDLLDIEADRRHARKRLRPFAAGDLSAISGAAILVLFLALSFGGALFLAPAFQAWLALYLVTTLSYSLFLKRIALIDVLVLSGLYTLRIQAGGAATGTPISHWMAGFSIFLFLSLAFVKRFAELENLRASTLPPRNGRGYLVADIEQLRALGTSSFFAAVVIFAIYISSKEVMALYHHPNFLWLIVPLQILWLSRVWLLASRGQLNEDPVVFALTDRLSLLIGVAVAAVAFAAL